jgi:hypothetical protein
MRRQKRRRGAKVTGGADLEGVEPRKGNRSLVFLSSWGPERTTIVVLDKTLKVELLYDSSQEKKEIVPGIGRIDSIHVKAPGILLLEERTARNAPIQGPPRTGRTFLIDVTKGTFQLSRIEKIY